MNLRTVSFMFGLGFGILIHALSLYADAVMPSMASAGFPTARVYRAAKLSRALRAEPVKKKKKKKNRARKLAKDPLAALRYMMTCA